MASDKKYNTEVMAEIILCLIKNFGKKKYRLAKYLIERLIRKESDSQVPFHKSKKAKILEDGYRKKLKKFKPLNKLSRGSIYNISPDWSGEIRLEHGLPEWQAIKEMFDNPDEKNIEKILKEVRDNLVYITTKEATELDKIKDPRKKKNGYYWKDIYEKVTPKIDVTPNNNKPEGIL